MNTCCTCALLLCALLASGCPSGGDSAIPEGSPPEDTGPFDADGDGFTAVDGDCDDGEPDVHPGAEELCNDRDDDCDEEIDEGLDQLWYQDQDGDGYGADHVTLTDCEQPAGYAAEGGDCDDMDAGVFPGSEG